MTPISASKIAPLKYKKHARCFLCVHRVTEGSLNFFLEREWAKVLLVGAEEKSLSGFYRLLLFPVFEAVALIAGFDDVANGGASDPGKLQSLCGAVFSLKSQWKARRCGWRCRCGGFCGAVKILGRQGLQEAIGLTRKPMNQSAQSLIVPTLQRGNAALDAPASYSFQKHMVKRDGVN
ncbi:hypothetical protein [Desulfobulbus sp.]|uniref:hypothetical protein n=1 Tax=Desulfobulbus sp. TaxID=895 RepID=UPI0027BB08D0|nr:hypothetical protein [Desulfobulbus sp.]